METDVERTLRHLRLILARGNDLDALDIRTEIGEWVAASQAVKEAISLIEQHMNSYSREWMLGWNDFLLYKGLSKEASHDFAAGYRAVAQWIETGHGEPEPFEFDHRAQKAYEEGFRDKKRSNPYKATSREGIYNVLFNRGQVCRAQYDHFH